MYELLQAGTITEVTGSQNVAYVLNDDNLFLLTGYKVLKSQTKDGFIACAKLLFNGKTKLVYFSSGYRSLTSIMQTIDTDAFLLILKDLLRLILEIKNNGFLNCRCLDLSFDKIFFNHNDLKVNLIYLPLGIAPTDVSVFENDLRTRLTQFMASVPSLKTEDLDCVSEKLSDNSVSLTDLYMTVCEAIQPELVFTAMNTANHPEFKIKKPEFSIGRNAASVDGVIGLSKTIGRIHCKIVFQNRKYYIVDLGSINGTYVNKLRISPHEMQPLRDGDIVRIADGDFIIHV